MITRIEDIPFTKCINPPIKLQGGTGKYYIVFTGIWYECTLEVFNTVTTDQIREKWVREKTDKYNTLQFSTVINSNSNSEKYKVVYDRYWSCECKGYLYRKNCSHIEKAKELLKQRTS